MANPANTPGYGKRPGFFAYLAGLLSATAAYLRARLELAGIEAKEAAVHYLVLVAMLVIALGAVVFGYLFFCLALVFALAALIGGVHTWIWITFGLAALHFGAAVTCVLIGKARLMQPMFSATLEEFRKDQEWLTNESRS